MLTFFTPGKIEKPNQILQSLRKFTLEYNKNISNFLYAKYYNNTGSCKYLFFGKCFKNTTEYFPKFLLFYLKLQYIHTYIIDHYNPFH